MREMCLAMCDICDQNPGVGILYPVHPNPNVRRAVDEILRGHPRVLLTDPLDYLTFVQLLKRCTLILTDSGGIQEEAPSLGKPVLVMRDKTERPEGVEAGVTRLVGTNRRRIVDEANRLLRDPAAFERMASGANPFGDGKASQRIVAAVRHFLGVA
jgi:UDP-N-acetylglucosamine 2-epimerase (non-hydrolysing)